MKARHLFLIGAGIGTGIGITGTLFAYDKFKNNKKHSKHEQNPRIKKENYTLTNINIANEKDFKEYPAHHTMNPDDYDYRHGPWEINIKLPTLVEPKTLPYKEVFDEKYLNKHEVNRSKQFQLFARGDKRRIEDIHKTGGIHPNLLLNPPPQEPIDPLNIANHRTDSTHSGFVSVTTDMLIAHTFGHAQYTQQKLNARYTVYIVSAAGTLGPSEKIDVCNESEHSVPGGIDYQDIASYRECFFNTANPSKITCESIFVANKFEKKHPHLVPPILKALRFPSEQTSRQESEEKKRSSFK